MQTKIPHHSVIFTACSRIIFCFSESVVWPATDSFTIRKNQSHSQYNQTALSGLLSTWITTYDRYLHFAKFHTFFLPLKLGGGSHFKKRNIKADSTCHSEVLVRRNTRRRRGRYSRAGSLLRSMMTSSRYHKTETFALHFLKSVTPAIRSISWPYQGSHIPTKMKFSLAFQHASQLTWPGRSASAEGEGGYMGYYGIWSTSGRYASYCNAFLLIKVSSAM